MGGMSKKVVFVLGSAHVSGGTYVILQHAAFLQANGYEVSIALVYMQIDDLLDLKNSASCWHPALKTLNFYPIDDLQKTDFDIAIFTWWATLLSFSKIKTQTTIYFVQSIESRFYSERDAFLRHLADKTYQIGLPVITEATWIQRYLETHYHAQVHLAKNGILKTAYQASGPVKAAKSITQLRILIEGPVEPFYKNIERTVAVCHTAKVGEIWLLTSSSIHQYEHVDRVFSQVPIAETAEIYRSCDVLVKLSLVEGMFGPPLEMFHCGGTAIVYAVTGFDEYIEHEKNALVAAPHDEAQVIAFLHRLQNDRPFLERLTQHAKITATHWRDWDQASHQFLLAMEAFYLRSPKHADILHAIDKLFSQSVTIRYKYKDKTDLVHLTAKPLYDNGHYLLAFPLSDKLLGINIYFGQLYQEFNLIGLALSDNSEAHYTGEVQLETKDLYQNEDQRFVCETRDAELIIHVTIRKLHAADEQVSFLNLHFQVIS
jgi:hypothetical protein